MHHHDDASNPLPVFPSIRYPVLRSKLHQPTLVLSARSTKVIDRVICWPVSPGVMAPPFSERRTKLIGHLPAPTKDNDFGFARRHVAQFRMILGRLHYHLQVDRSVPPTSCLSFATVNPT